MQKIILIRYDEIHLKGNNRGFFEGSLLRNIRASLGKEIPVSKIRGRFLASATEENADEAIGKLQKIFGIHSLSIAAEIENDFEKICETALASIKPSTKNFRITVNRAEKNFPKNSLETARDVGAYILSKKPALKVDLFGAEQDIKIDIRENGKTYVFTDTFDGPGGMPVGTGGKGIALLSGGIDSPVAAYYMAKRGMGIDALHFHSFPYTSKRALEKAVSLKNILKLYIPNIKLYALNTAKIQEAINENCPEAYHIILLRRFMMRLASIVAKKNGAGAIITGESLAQVASQTIESLTATNAVAELPVFRPLIGFDKEEIIRVAKKIDTYTTSVLPHEDCCTVFLPKNPATKPKLYTVERFEEILDISALIEDALTTLEIL